MHLDQADLALGRHAAEMPGYRIECQPARQLAAAGAGCGDVQTGRASRSGSSVAVLIAERVVRQIKGNRHALADQDLAAEQGGIGHRRMVADDRTQRHRAVAEYQALNAGQDVDALIAIAAAVVDHPNLLGVRVIADPILGQRAGVDRRIAATSTIERVIAQTAFQGVIALAALQQIGRVVAVDAVVAGTADGVLDHGPGGNMVGDAFSGDQAILQVDEHIVQHRRGIDCVVAGLILQDQR